MNLNNKNLFSMGFAVLTMSMVACAADSKLDSQQTATVAEDKVAVVVEQAAQAPMPEKIVVAAVDSEGRELDEDGFPIPKQKKKLGKAPDVPKDAMTPYDRVKAAPVGTLKNPYAHELNAMAKWGKQRYMGNSCNGCHGGTGGGGMCPPISNSTWVYGHDDDTLFRLITLGSVELQKQLKISRKGRENVVGPMPAFGGIIKTDDEVWRIISYLRTIYKGDPKFDARNVH